MMPFILEGMLVAASAMILLWVLQLLLRDAGVVDCAWAALIGALALYYAYSADGHILRRVLAALFGGVWGFRLAFHILIDRVIGKPEDGRYAAMREHFGKRAQLFFFGFFLFQALLAVAFSIPYLVIALDPAPPSPPVMLVAISIWLLSVLGESAADSQLSQWRRDPANRGKTCRAGLWNYSRHPNYFFEWMHWWAYVVLAFSSPHWWVTVVAPLVMLLFLFRVTGIPYTEKQALKSRGDDYREYQRTTSVFFPWPKKKPHQDVQESRS